MAPKKEKGTYRRGLEDEEFMGVKVPPGSGKALARAFEAMGGPQAKNAFAVAIEKMGGAQNASAIAKAIEASGAREHASAISFAIDKLGGGAQFASERWTDATSMTARFAPANEAKQVPLYVMVAPEQLERFKALAKKAGMSLREYVTNAVEAFSAQMSTTNDELGEMLGVANASSDQLRSMVSSQQVRLSTLETRVDALQKRLDRQWGAGQPDRDGPPDPPIPVYEQDSFLEGLNAEADRLLGRDERKKK